MTTRNYDVELRPIEAIQPYPGNPRVNDGAVDAVAASLKEFGFRQPIVVDAEGVIVVGHTRWKAAQKLGLGKVPVHVATDLPPEKVKAYRIADNQTATLAEWDFELLPIELKDLQRADYDLSLLGFGEEELAYLLDGDVAEGLTDPEHVPEPPDDPVTRRGDLWVLGDHRLMCGDSGSAEDLDRLLDGAVIDLRQHGSALQRPGRAPQRHGHRGGHERRLGPRLAEGLAPPGLRPGPGRGRSEQGTEEDARQGSAARKRLRDLRVLRRDAAGLVRQRRAGDEAGRGVLHLGRVCQHRQLSRAAGGRRALLQPGDRLGQDASRADPKRLSSARTR
jgi:hypothetical protein